MFVAAASYHQMIPSILDFLFSFGAQHHAKDFLYAGFRQDTRLIDSEKTTSISALGRSGRAIQLCYSLRSVEAVPRQEEWPWSVRNTALHHTFDLESGRTSWLIVKGEGGASMKERIINETSSPKGTMFEKFSSPSQVFSTTFISHLLLCNWSVENWRWYINFMEEEVQKITRKTLSMTIASPQTEPKPRLLFTRTATGVLVPPKKTPTNKSLGMKSRPAIPMVPVSPPTPNGAPPGLPGLPPSLPTTSNPANFDAPRRGSEFSFEDLRRIEFIEEHANQALLVMALNDKVLSALLQHYNTIIESTHLPPSISSDCGADYKRFANQLSDMCAEIQTQRARVKTLLQLLEDRKALVTNLPWQSMPC